jgi:hypothetical protein
MYVVFLLVSNAYRYVYRASSSGFPWENEPFNCGLSVVNSVIYLFICAFSTLGHPHPRVTAVSVLSVHSTRDCA